MKSYKWIAVMAVTMTLLAISGDAMAADDLYKSGVGQGAGLAIGLAVIGGGIGQGFAARAALEGIACNPTASTKIFTPMIICLALVESLVIYALVVSYWLSSAITGG